MHLSNTFLAIFSEKIDDDLLVPQPVETPKAKEEDYGKEAEAQPEQLAPHDMDIPEEPERVLVKLRVWSPDFVRGADYKGNPILGGWVEHDQGYRMLVPTGCEQPEYLNPFSSDVVLKSYLPRDRDAEANLYTTYQNNLWASTKWIRGKLDQGLQSAEQDKEIADEIPMRLAMQGQADPSGGVAQTTGAPGQGDNNGAPFPGKPGPGRGNKITAGDGLAKKPQTPGNASPGTGL